MKFSFTGETKAVFGTTLKRIQRDDTGEVGGWVEGAGNLSMDGAAWVSGDAMVYGDAWVHGDAQVSGAARVYGDAQVYGAARVYGDAWVHGDAQVSGTTSIMTGELTTP